MSLTRKFDWISSVDDRNCERLDALHEQLAKYYTEAITRLGYREMIKVEESLAPTDIITQSFLQWFQGRRIHKVLEVGCGEGRIFQYLSQQITDLDYTGIEMDEVTINNNILKWPSQCWLHKSVYNIDFEPKSFDLCFSFYVLEHLVYPTKALERMLEMVKPGGYLLLVFPDFTRSGRFPSQHIGIGPDRSALKKLKKGRLVDAVISLYDSRIRLKPSLKKISEQPGKFLINANPLCLHFNDEQLWPDIDAVYLASKIEVAKWAEGKGLEAVFPFGTNSPFDEHTFMTIKK